jgi:hypothetical protein
MSTLSLTCRFVGAVVIAALLFTFTGADPAGAWPWPAALAFWLLSVGVGLGLASAAAAVLARRPGWASRPRWLVIALAGVCGLLLYTPLSLALEDAFPGPPEDDDSWLDVIEAGGLPGRLLAELLQAGPAYLLTWGLINLLAPWQGPTFGDPLPALPSRGAAPPAALPADTSVEPARSAAAVLGWPPALGDEVVCVTADLHYLQVATRRGRATVLGSLAAVERHFGSAGLRVHRSHWVALNAVRSVRRTAAGWVCVLDGGACLPVSRRRVAEVRASLGVDFFREDT